MHIDIFVLVQFVLPWSLLVCIPVRHPLTTSEGATNRLYDADNNDDGRDGDSDGYDCDDVVLMVLPLGEDDKKG